MLHPTSAPANDLYSSRPLATPFRCLPIRTCVVLLTALLAAAAQADPIVLQATQDPGVESSFTLDFGQYGGTRVAQITSTQYNLETDANAGAAHFLSYYQTVDPIELPGGVSTGNLTVTIQESLPGPYDPATGLFATQDVYLIYFDGDLSAFGLTSPVALPGSATGTILYDSPTSGIINSRWDGQGELQNPYDPTMPIAFGYTCVSNMQFIQIPEPQTLGLVALAALVARRRRA